MSTDSLFTDREYALPETDGYRPLSPAAVLSVVAGLIALLTGGLVSDLGVLTFVAASIVAMLIGLRGVQSVRRYDMTGLGLARAGITLSVLALALGGGLQTYIALYEIPDGYFPISYERLQPDGAAMIPATAQSLDGQRVFIKGYMYPGNETTGIKEFVLCRDNGTCCFGGQPKLNDMIQVKLKAPLTLDYHTGLRQIGGIFRASASTASDGLGTVLYQIEADFAR